MRTVFADTLYWIALVNSRDQWHQRALSINADLRDARLVTTDSVLTELANFFAEYGEIMRRKVALTIRTVLSDDLVEVLPEARQTFLDGLTLYESRSDKAYSLTDCIAMNVMMKRGITDVLTHDTHFSQALALIEAPAVDSEKPGNEMSEHESKDLARLLFELLEE